MKYETQEFVMSDGNKNIVHSWLPETEVKAVLLISHGMAEHVERYKHFADLLTKDGFAVYGEDHRGHGKTAQLAKEEGKGDFGFLAEKDGFFRVVDDIYEEALKLKDMYKGKKLFLFGHSFGSFVTQCFIEKYGSCLDGCIICGTAGPRKATVATAKFIGNCIKKLRGAHSISKTMDSLAFGSYNSHIKKARTKVDWLSRDNNAVDAYIADPWCGFMCTIGFFCDMFAGLSFIHKKESIKGIPQNLPVYFIDGTGDPVGSYSKTVQNLYKIYKENGMADVSLKLYENARHELLNEINRDEVENDAKNWLLKHC